jgi:hypothetical protein
VRTVAHDGRGVATASSGGLASTIVAPPMIEFRLNRWRATVR